MIGKLVDGIKMSRGKPQKNWALCLEEGLETVEMEISGTEGAVRKVPTWYGWGI